MGGPQSTARPAETAHVLTATLFQTIPLQPAEAQVVSTASQQNSQAVTDVIQQLLELSEPGPVESNQSPQPGQQLSITVGLNQDILQQALENSGLSSIPVAAHPSDASHAKASATQTQSPDVSTVSTEPADAPGAEQEKEQESPEKLDKKRKKNYEEEITIFTRLHPRGERGAVARVSLLHQGVPEAQRPGAPHPHPHAREALQVPAVLPGLRGEEHADGAHQDAHGHQGLQVPALHEELLHLGQPQGAHPPAHRSQAFCLSSL